MSGFEWSAQHNSDRHSTTQVAHAHLACRKQQATTSYEIDYVRIGFPEGFRVFRVFWFQEPHPQRSELGERLLEALGRQQHARTLELQGFLVPRAAPAAR